MNLTEYPSESVEENGQIPAHWAIRGMLLWQHRTMLARVTVISFIVSLVIAFLIPKEYKSTASIMPPDQNGSSAMMLAALFGHTGLGSLGSFASGLLGGRGTTALYIDLLESGTVRGRLIDRFDLQHVYHTRYRFSTAKKLGHYTKITEDKKSGVLTIEVEDTDRARARDLAQAYLDELNKILNRTSTSSARQERLFIEHRLDAVKTDLERAQLELSDFSSKNSTIDIKEQTRAMVDAGARVQAELLVEQAGLQSLREIYGDANVRVKGAEARIATLQHKLIQMTGSSAPLKMAAVNGDTNAVPVNDKEMLYPPLRQLPRLGVTYADLYRRVKVQETVFELLTQQYEMARIEEAKDIPVVNVIDSPGLPEKKSFPPRILLTLFLTFFSLGIASGLVLVQERWSLLSVQDPRRMLVAEIVPVIRRRWRALASRRSAS